jgi:hypothetical protein
MFLYNISSSRMIRRICQLFAIIVLIWGTATIFSSAFACRAPNFWAFSSGKCINFAIFYRATGAIDILTDLILVLIAAYVFTNIRFDGQSRVSVIIIICVRILVIVPAINRMKYINNAAFNSGADISWTKSGFLLYGSMHMNVSIVFASLTSVWPFLRSLECYLTGDNDQEHIHHLQNNDSDETHYQPAGLAVLNAWAAKFISVGEASIELVRRHENVGRESIANALKPIRSPFEKAPSSSINEDDCEEDPIKFIKGLRPDFTDYEGIVTGASQYVEGPLRSRSSASWEQEMARTSSPDGRMSITKTIGYGVRSETRLPP